MRGLLFFGLNSLLICNLHPQGHQTIIRTRITTMRSGNPVLQDSTFTDVSRGGYSNPMTLTGSGEPLRIAASARHCERGCRLVLLHRSPVDHLPDRNDRIPWRVCGGNRNFI